MRNTLENIEEALKGFEMEIIDMPVFDLPDYLPRMDGGSSGGC
jgi:hypothetical protein